MQPVNTFPTKPKKGADLEFPCIVPLAYQKRSLSHLIFMIRHLLPISSQRWGLASGKCQSDVHQRSIPQPSIKTLSTGHVSNQNLFLMDILWKRFVCECFDLIMPRINSSRAAVFFYGRAFYVTYIQQEFYQSCNSPWYLKNFYM